MKPLFIACFLVLAFYGAKGQDSISRYDIDTMTRSIEFSTYFPIYEERDTVPCFHDCRYPHAAIQRKYFSDHKNSLLAKITYLTEFFPETHQGGIMRVDSAETEIYYYKNLQLIKWVKISSTRDSSWLTGPFYFSEKDINEWDKKRKIKRRPLMNEKGRLLYYAELLLWGFENRKVDLWGRNPFKR